MLLCALTALSAPVSDRWEAELVPAQLERVQYSCQADSANCCTFDVTKTLYGRCKRIPQTETCGHFHHYDKKGVPRRCRSNTIGHCGESGKLFGKGGCEGAVIVGNFEEYM